MQRGLTHWFAALVVLMGGAWLVGPGHGGVAPLDRAGLALAHAWSHPVLNQAMAAITWLGSIWLLLPSLLVAAIALWRAGQARRAAFLVLSVPGATALAQLFKFLAARPRPDWYPALTDLPLDASYPSAHTMQAVAAALALGALAGGRWRGVLLLTPALLVGWSRIHLQVHFPSDVLAGGLAAAFWVFGLHALIFGRVSKSGEDGAGVDKVVGEVVGKAANKTVGKAQGTT